MKIVFFFMLFLYFNCLGQVPNAVENSKYSLIQIGTSFSFHPLDFFHGIEVSRKTGSFTPTFSLAYGINRTIFQARFFPSIQVFVPYQFQQINQKFPKIKLGIGPNLNYSFLKINKATKHHQFWQEYLLSYRLEYGEKWKLTQQSGFGIRSERYFSDLSKDFKHVISPSYSISLGLAYRL